MAAGICTVGGGGDLSDQSVPHIIIIYTYILGPGAHMRLYGYGGGMIIFLDAHTYIYNIYT